MKYVNEQNCLILISLLKKYNISDIVVSPGTTNIPFVVSVARDSFFKLYSVVDERSACYVACGIAKSKNVPVVITCTGATASRNYYPGLTEAYYSKLPILVVTCSNPSYKLGNLFPQVTNRNDAPSDILKLSVELPFIDKNCPEWHANDLVNKALLALSVNGGGPSHINLYSSFSNKCTLDVLPETRKINYFTSVKDLPDLEYKNVLIFIGSHKPFTKKEIDYIDLFCDKYNAIVISDLTSNYHGKYSLNTYKLLRQDNYRLPFALDLIIHIGDISSTYHSFYSKNVWRVSTDGLISNHFYNLTSVFRMEEADFFKYYSELKKTGDNQLFDIIRDDVGLIDINRIEIPYSNLWCAQKLHDRIPKESNLHLAIFNSLRSWNYFNIDNTISVYSNVGGFGIDGCTSTSIGFSLANHKKLNYLVTGDLAFFYDLNSLGIKSVKPNLRILVINNGCGCEMRLRNNIGSSFPEENDNYFSALGHYKSSNGGVICAYAEALGFDYISAKNKEEFIQKISLFVDNTVIKPIVFEAFVDEKDDVEADFIIRNIISKATNTSKGTKFKSIIKRFVRKKYEQE